jgi:hypothetical protein
MPAPFRGAAGRNALLPTSKIIPAPLRVHIGVIETAGRARPTRTNTMRSFRNIAGAALLALPYAHTAFAEGF